MKLQTQILVAALVGLTVFAGCSGKAQDAEKPGTTVTPTFGDDTGAIYGQVLGEDQLPIEGVQVQARELADQGIKVTNADGEFDFSQIAPGTYTLDFQKLGYKALTQKVEVAVGEPPKQQFTLLQILPAVPYADPQEQTGRIFVSAGWKVEGCPVDPFATCQSVSVAPGSAVSPENYQNIHNWNVTDPEDNKVQTIVAELKWASQNAVCPGSFQFDVIAPGISTSDIGDGVSGDDPRKFAANTSDSPIVVRIERADLAARGLVDDKKGTSDIESSEDRPWFTRVFADSSGTTNTSTADAGCVVDQPFTVYFTVFYGDPAPSGYSAVSG